MLLFGLTIGSLIGGL